RLQGRQGRGAGGAGPRRGGLRAAADRGADRAVGGGVVTGRLDPDDLLWFVDRALEGMLETCRTLGEELVNARLEVEGSNSPYAIVVHCVGVMDFWAGHKVAGRPNHRDRDAEFRAAGTIADLEAHVAAGRQRFVDALAGADWAATCVGQARPETHVLA